MKKDQLINNQKPELLIIDYAMLSLRRTGIESVWVVGSLIICASILAHGLTAVPLTKLYGKRVQT